MASIQRRQPAGGAVAHRVMSREDPGGTVVTETRDTPEQADCFEALVQRTGGRVHAPKRGRAGARAVPTSPRRSRGTPTRFPTSPRPRRRVHASPRPVWDRRRPARAPLRPGRHRVVRRGPGCGRGEGPLKSTTSGAYDRRMLLAHVALIVAAIALPVVLVAGLGVLAAAFVGWTGQRSETSPMDRE